MTLSSAGLLTIADDLVIKDGGTIGVASDADSITIASSGVATFSQKDIHSAGISVKNGATSAGFIEFFEDSDNGTNKVTLIGPASTADITLTLPSSAGTIALTTDIATAGISSGNVATFGSGVADNDFLKIDGTTVEGRSAAEVLSDIGAITASSSDTLTNKILTTPIANAGIQLKNGATSAGFLEFFEDSDNGTNKVTLIGPAATTDVTLTLPNVTASTSLTALNLAQEFTASQNFDEQSLTDGANIDWNLQTQQVATVTLAGNRTFNAPSNHVAGLVCVLTIVQDGSGSRTADYNSVFKFTGGSAPTLTTTAAARDILVFISDGTNLREIGRSLNPS